MESQNYDIDVKIDRPPESKQITVNVTFEGKHLYSTFDVLEDEKENERIINREINRLVTKEAMKRTKNHVQFHIAEKFKVPLPRTYTHYATREEAKEAKKAQDALYHKQHRAELNEYQKKWYAERKKQSPIVAT
jgi:hypothetical protein